MIELWLVISTVCFANYAHPLGMGNVGVVYKFHDGSERVLAFPSPQCVQKVSISTFPVVAKQEETVYKVVKTGTGDCEDSILHDWKCMHSRLEGDACDSIKNSQREPIDHCPFQQCSLCRKWRKLDKCGVWVEE